MRRMGVVITPQPPWNRPHPTRQSANNNLGISPRTHLVVGEARAEPAQRVGRADEHGIADLARRLNGLLHARGWVVGVMGESDG